MEFDCRSFKFTPDRVKAAIKFARETDSRWVWKDISKESPHLYLIVGKRTAKYYLRVKKNGKDQTSAVGSAEGGDLLSLGEARDRANAMRYGAEFTKNRRSKNLTLGVTSNDLWERCMSECESGTFTLVPKKKTPYSKKTIRNYRSNWSAHIADKYGNKDFGRVIDAALDIIRGIHAKQDHGALGNQVMAALNLAIGYAKRRNIYNGKNPLKDPDDNPRGPVPRHEVNLTKDQAAAVKAAFDELDEFWADLFMFLALTGRRLRNVTDLQWSQVDLKTLQIFYEGSQMKNSNPANVPVLAALEAILKRRREAVPKSCLWVFPAIKSQDKAINNPYHQWEHVRAASGLPKIQPKSLRHLFVTWALRKGVPLVKVSKAANHQQTATTQQYTHLVGNDSIEAFAALESAWGEI